MPAAALIVNATALATGSPAPRAVVAVATSPLRNATSPRLSAGGALQSALFHVVAAGPTAWCTAELAVCEPIDEVLRQIPCAFPQLRRIALVGGIAKGDTVGPLLAQLNPFTIREVELVLHSAIITSANIFFASLGAIAARLEVLVFDTAYALSDEDLTQLRGMPRLRSLALGNPRADEFSAGANTISDDALAALLADTRTLRSLAIHHSSQMTGEFLACLREEVYGTLSELLITSCRAFGDRGAAHLDKLRGLTKLNIQVCSQVSQLPFAGLAPLACVDTRFLMSCHGLTSLDLSPLRNITELKECFLYDMAGLCAIDLTGLANVTAVGPYFLAYNRSLTSVTLAMPNLTRCDHHCMEAATSMTALDATALAKLTVVGGDWLMNCTALQHVRLTPALLARGSGVPRRLKALHRASAASS